MYPSLVKPEFNFVVAVLGPRGELVDVDFSFAATIKITGDNISELGNGAGANIAFDTVFILVHKKEDISLVEVFIEALINFCEAGSVVGIA